MVICRSASWSSSSRGMRGLLASDATEHRADRQTETGQIAATENVASHDFSGGEHVARRARLLQDDVGLLVDRNAAIRERHTGLQRIAVERWCIDRHRPVTLRRIEPLGVTIVKR